MAETNPHRAPLSSNSSYSTDTRLLSIVIFEAYENGRWTAFASISLIYTVALISRRFMRAAL